MTKVVHIAHFISLHILLILFYYLFPFSFSPIFIYIFSCVMFHCFIAYVIFIVLLLLLFYFFCTFHWADLSWPTFHYWLYPVWLCMWQIIKNLEPNMHIWSEYANSMFWSSTPNGFSSVHLTTSNISSHDCVANQHPQRSVNQSKEHVLDRPCYSSVCLSRMSALITEACLCAAPRPLTQCSVLICCLAPSCTAAIHRYKLETDSVSRVLLSPAQSFSPLVSFVCCLLGWPCYRSRPPVVWAWPEHWAPAQPEER